MSTVDELPIGTVTFLFTDIEGSTQLLKQLGGEVYGAALGDHQRILRETFSAHGGHEIDTQGDSFFVAFGRAKDAVSCAIACQRRLAEHSWPAGTELRVRMGIHTGEPAMGGQRYVGLGVNRGARIAAAGHGGQVLVSQTTRELLRDDPVPDVTLRDLGEHQLKDMDEPERIYQLVAPGLEEDFPELKTAASTPFEGREGELAVAATEELAKRWRRPGRRTLILATLGAALVGATLGVLLTQGGGSTANASVSANAVGVVESDGSIAAEVPVGVAPGGIAAGPGAVWVTNTGENTVSRIDPSTNDVRQTIAVGQGPSGVAVTPNAVWVANGLDAAVSRIDPETSRVSQTISVGNGPTGAAAGEGAVWVTNSADGTVSQIDPESGRVTRTVPVIVGAAGIAVGFQKVWVVSPPAGKVVAIDPGSGRVIKEIGVGVDPSAVAVGDNAVWVTNRADGTISKIEPSTGVVVGTVAVGRGPTGITAGPGEVWVANAGDSTLSRVDPESVSVVKSIPLGNPPRDVVWRPEGSFVAVGSSGAEHTGGNLEVLVGTMDSVDPALAYDTASWAVLTMTNDGLVGFRKVGGVQGTQLVPNLAVALPVLTEGGKAYAFQLRPGIHYSNGTPVEPVDFRRALERVFELGSAGAFYYAGIVGASRCSQGKSCDLSRGIVSDRATRTITFHLTKADGDFLSKLALPFAFAVPAKTPAHETGTRPLPATGPYRIASYNTKAKLVRLVRNPRFREWSADAQPSGFPNSISLSWAKGFNEPLARIRAVERGRADVAFGYGPPVPPDELEVLAARYPSQLRLSPAFATFYFFLNTRVRPFDDLATRRAVSAAFDPQALAESLGIAFAPSCRILPPNIPGYRPTCPKTPALATGVERARQLVRRAGAAGESVTVWVPTPFAAQGRDVAALLRSIGFRARSKVIEPVPDIGAYFAKVSDSRTGAQMGWSGWTADYPSASSFIPPLLSCAAFVPASPQETSNLAEFCDPAIDEQMARATALQAQNPPEATLLWQRIETELLLQAPNLPWVSRRNIDFVSKRVGNYLYNPQWGALLSQLWVK